MQKLRLVDQMTNRFLGNVLFSTVVLTEDMFGSIPINGLILPEDYCNSKHIRQVVPICRRLKIEE